LLNGQKEDILKINERGKGDGSNKPKRKGHYFGGFGSADSLGVGWTAKGSDTLTGGDACVLGGTSSFSRKGP